MSSKHTNFSASIFLFCVCLAAQAGTQTGGFIKTLGNYSRYAEDSVFYQQEGASTSSGQLELRVNLAHEFSSSSQWDFNIDSQLLVIDDNTDFNNFSLTNTSLDDQTRLLDLSTTLSETNPQSVLRLDRFNLGYTGERLVLRAGRQALSWGNGLLFSVMDIVNPFDGRVYDQEYKIGDDMLYLQYLLADGSDAQFAAVLRRNPENRELESEQHTFAGKYHAFFGSYEIDFLLAQHYSDDLFALGVSGAVGGAVAYAELATTRSETQDFSSGLAGINYSWVWFARNFSGAFEYYHNDVGMKGDFSYSDVLANTFLLERISRGEAALLAKNYLAVTSTIELTPLLLNSATFFYSLEDHSALLQLSSQYDWLQNLQAFVALALPLGEDGGEFSGLASTQPGLYLSSEWQLQARLAWYF